MSNEVKKDQDSSKKPMREIVIKTDWNSIHIEKAEVSGSLEFKSILISLLENISK